MHAAIAVSHAKHIGGEILGNSAHGSKKCVFAHAGELVHCGKPAQDNIVGQMHMTGKGGAVGHYDIVFHTAVVGHMGIRHQQVVVAYAGNPASAFGAAVQGRIFANGVVVAYFKPGFFSVEFEILRFSAHTGIRMDVVVAAKPGVALDGRKSVHPGSFPNHHMIFNYRARSDDDLVGQFRSRGDDGRCVNVRSH